MPLGQGSRIGPYEIVASLGAGGMGEVYRARDSRLKRQVALKVLPDEFARDVDRLARFQREAEALASLNHPGIAAIYDLASEGDVQVLVMELVEGDTLADRIARGPVPIPQLLDIARQLADALAVAHEQGVVHRDLKPANIKVAPDGAVKVLDFGLAKMREAGRHATQAASATSLPITSAGVILGTAPYMSPEQASGQDTDRSTDIWAFGCVLYEMATGLAAFAGKTTTEILGAVFARDPDWSRLPAPTPEPLRRLLRRCLRREKALRLHDIGDARIEIEEARDSQEGNPKGLPPQGSGSEGLPPQRLWMVASGLATLVAIGAVIFALRPGPPPPAEVQLDIATPTTTDLVSFALSPDGRRIVFVAESEGRPQLWVRALESPSARALPATDFAVYPFWSPDSASIAFFADGRLKRVDIGGGAPQVLARVSVPRGGAWLTADTIVFGENGPLYRVASSGGQPSPIAGLPQLPLRFPQPLPGGRRFLYYSLGNADTRGVYVGSIDGSPSQRLLDADTSALYSPSGHLFFVRQGTLVAQRFDAATLTLSGAAVPVAEQVSRDPLSIQVAAVSISAAGPIAYRSGAVGVARSLVWFDRAGTALATVGEPGTAGQNTALSPDGLRVASDRAVAGNVDIWLTDVQRGVDDRLTSDAAIEADPTWSADGRTIAFGAIRTSVMDLFRRPSTSTGGEELLLSSSDPKAPTDWARDGRHLLYRSTTSERGYDLWALPIGSDGKAGTPFVVAQSEFDERDGMFSPDGQWVAYESNESDRSEIYIQRFPKPDGRIRVSANGGAQVRWASNGRELFYIALDGRLMGAPVRPSADGRSLDIGQTVPLFATHVGGALQGAARQRYMVSSDGQRFLMNTIAGDPARPLTIILNWSARPKP